MPLSAIFDHLEWMVIGAALWGTFGEHLILPALAVVLRRGR